MFLFRLHVVIAIALLILWQSNCLTIENGSLINRCGLWQWTTGQAIIISFKKEETKKADIAPTTTFIINGSIPTVTNSAICIGGTTCTTPISPTIIYSGSSIISSSIVTMPYNAITNATMSIDSYDDWRRRNR